MREGEAEGEAETADSRDYFWYHWSLSDGIAMHIR